MWAPLPFEFMPGGSMSPWFSCHKNLKAFLIRDEWCAHAALDSVMQRWENSALPPLIYDNAALARLLTCCQPQSHGNKQAAREAPPGALRQSRRHRRESTQRPVASIFHCQRSASHLSMVAGGDAAREVMWGFFFRHKPWWTSWKAQCEMSLSLLLCPSLQGPEKWDVSAPSLIQPEDACSCINKNWKKNKKWKQNHREREFTYAFRENYHLEVEKVFTKDCCCSSVMANEPLCQKTTIFTQAQLLAVIVSESLQIQMKWFARGRPLFLAMRRDCQIKGSRARDSVWEIVFSFPCLATEPNLSLLWGAAKRRRR